MNAELTADARTELENAADLALTVVEDTLEAWGELADRDLAEKHFADRSVTGTLQHESTAIVDMHPCLGALNAIGVGDDPGHVPAAESVRSLAEDLAQINRVLNESVAPLAEARELAALLDGLETEDDEDDETLEAETEDEAEDLVEDLETGDRVEVTRHGMVQTYRVTSTDEGKFTGKRTDAYKAGTTTFKPTLVGNYALATHGRGISSRFGRVEVVAQSIEGHRPEDAETNDAMSEDEAEDLLNRGVVVEDMDGDRHRVTVREDTGGIHLEPVGDGWASVGALDMGVEKLVTGTWTPVETVVGTLEDDGEDDGAAQDRVVCTDGGRDECYSCGEPVADPTTIELTTGEDAPHCEPCAALVDEGDEAEARHMQANGEPTLTLDATHADDVDALTDPFTTLDVSATDVFTVEVDGRRVVTETFRVASDGSFTVAPAGEADTIDGRHDEATERLERIEWYGELVN